MLDQIDPQGLYTPQQAARLIPPAGVSMPTMWRWLLRGIAPRPGAERIKLKSTKYGGRRVVTGQDLLDFFAVMSGEPIPSTPLVRTPAQRRRDSEAAERELRKMGC